jgi:hypothetical protein
MTSSRSSDLMKIMRIEDQEKQVSKDHRYRQIQENVDKLKSTLGSSVINISNPENMDKTITVRRNSPEAKAHLETYEHMLMEYNVLMGELSKEKKRFRSNLF